MHLRHITYFTWLGEELITVPSFPAWICDMCGKREYDERAIAWLVAPQLFATRDVHVAVDLGPGPSRGRKVIDRWGRLRQPTNARLLETLDAEGFFALLGTALRR